MHFYSAITIHPTPDQVLNQLYPCQRDRDHGDRFRCQAEQAIQAIQSIPPPCGLYVILEKSTLKDWPAMADQEMIAVALVTLGAEFDRILCSLRFHHGRLLETLFLDAAGSLCAELACDVLDNEISHDIAARHLHRSRRFSPGFPGFPLEEQHHVFQRLPAHAVGVTLTANMMMNPIKTVSFIVSAGSSPVDDCSDSPRSAGCAIGNCPYHNEKHHCSKWEETP